MSPEKEIAAPRSEKMRWKAQRTDKGKTPRGTKELAEEQSPICEKQSGQKEVFRTEVYPKTTAANGKKEESHNGNGSGGGRN